MEYRQKKKEGLPQTAVQGSFFSHLFVEVNVGKQSMAWLEDRRREGKQLGDRAGVDKVKGVLLSPAAQACHHHSHQAHSPHVRRHAPVLYKHHDRKHALLNIYIS